MRLVRNNLGSALLSTTPIHQKAPTHPPELLRTFIQDCLYNPDYGYFNRNVNIFQTSESIKFSDLANQDDYFNKLYGLYRERTVPDRKFYQLWHTPTELFKPFYAESIANYIIKHSSPLQDLVIYEVGPGNGTLCLNILDCLYEKFPDFYKKCTFNLIEISPHLSSLQKSRLSGKHRTVTNFINSSIFELPPDFIDNRASWIIGLEVLDNLPQDSIKYDPNDGSLLQSVVYTNESARFGQWPGKFWENFEPVSDALTLSLVQALDHVGYEYKSLKGHIYNRFLEENFGHLFNYRNPFGSEFIPTGPYLFLTKIFHHFPNHRLILSDFDVLPDAIKGHNSPVVQTRYKGNTVHCSTIFLQKGLFDIFFPINFNLFQHLYTYVQSKKYYFSKRSSNSPKIMRHSDFLRENSTDLSKTTTKSGYNPMIEDFENVAFFLT